MSDPLLSTAAIFKRVSVKLLVGLRVGVVTKGATLLLNELVESKLVDGNCELSIAKAFNAGCLQRPVNKPLAGMVAAAAGGVAGIKDVHAESFF